MQSRHGGLSLGRRVALGALIGLFWWPYWAMVTLAPAVADTVGVPEGFVGATLLGAGLGGAVLFGHTRIGRSRRRTAIRAIGFLVLPLAALGHMTASGAVLAALVLAGALFVIGDAAVQSAVTATLPTQAARRSGMVPVWFTRAALLLVGGPVCEWFAGRYGLAALFSSFAVLTLLVAVVMVRICPDPDDQEQPQQGSTQLVTTEEHGSWWSLAIASFCGQAQNTVFTVFIPLALTDRGVAGVGWLQGAFVFGLLTLTLTTRTTAAGTPAVSTRTSVLVGPLLVSSAAVVALVGEAVVDGVLMLVVAVAARIIASMGNAIHACTLTAVGGATARGKSALYVGSSGGGLASGLVCGAIWSTAAPDIRFEQLLAGALVLGIVSHMVTRRWLARLPEAQAPKQPSLLK